MSDGIAHERTSKRPAIGTAGIPRLMHTFRLVAIAIIAAGVTYSLVRSWHWWWSGPPPTAPGEMQWIPGGVFMMGSDRPDLSR